LNLLIAITEGATINNAIHHVIDIAVTVKLVKVTYFHFIKVVVYKI